MSTKELKAILEAKLTNNKYTKTAEAKAKSNNKNNTDYWLLAGYEQALEEILETIEEMEISEAIKKASAGNKKMTIEHAREIVRQAAKIGNTKFHLVTLSRKIHTYNDGEYITSKELRKNIERLEERIKTKAAK